MVCPFYTAEDRTSSFERIPVPPLLRSIEHLNILGVATRKSSRELDIRGYRGKGCERSINDKLNDTVTSTDMLHVPVNEVRVSAHAQHES
jgi:hypothetical protein